MIHLFKCLKTSSEATTWLTKKSSNLEASRSCEGLHFAFEKTVELGGNWIVAMIMTKVALIIHEVAMIIEKVAMISMKVATITKNVLILITVNMKDINCQPSAFAKGCFFVRKTEWD